MVEGRHLPGGAHRPHRQFHWKIDHRQGLFRALRVHVLNPLREFKQLTLVDQPPAAPIQVVEEIIASFFIYRD